MVQLSHPYMTTGKTIALTISPPPRQPQICLLICLLWTSHMSEIIWMGCDLLYLSSFTSSITVVPCIKTLCVCVCVCVCVLLLNAGSHHGRSHPRQRSCGENLTGKGRSGLERFPGSARASTPKPESVCLTILCLSPTLLTLAGGYLRPPFSGKNQLRALVNGHDRSVSIQTPLLAF